MLDAADLARKQARENGPGKFSTVKTSYFTFGQAHVHRVDGFTWDCDVVCKITAPDPRSVMVDAFGIKWAFEYASLGEVGIERYPRGVKELAS